MLGGVTPGPLPTPLPIRVPPKLKAPRVAEKPPPAVKAKAKEKQKDTEKENHEYTKEENHGHIAEEHLKQHQKKKKLIVTLRIRNALTEYIAEGATEGPAGAPSKQLQQGLNEDEPGPQSHGFCLKKPSRKAWYVERKSLNEQIKKIDTDFSPMGLRDLVVCANLGWTLLGPNYHRKMANAKISQPLQPPQPPSVASFPPMIKLEKHISATQLWVTLSKYQMQSPRISNGMDVVGTN